MSNTVSVTEINNYIRRMFDQDYMLSRVSVRGEVSNCKYHGSGHIYFSLKDAGGTLACVMFAGNRRGLKFRLEDGQEVVCTGHVSIYEARGSYQLYVSGIELSGAGALYEKYLKLKDRLEEMGMFDPIYKKPIPVYARTVGIVTADTGAAIRDIVKVAHRRNPYVRLILSPAIVQGDAAPASIVKALKKLEALKPDVIIVGRGGGSIEDLWAFNEEAVARAVFECPIPVISAVGHETDTTITDFTADLRAPTPSAAAEIAVYSYEHFEERLIGYEQVLSSDMSARIERTKERAGKYGMFLKSMSPARQIEAKRQKLSGYRLLMDHGIKTKLKGSTDRCEGLSQAVAGLMEKRMTGCRQKCLIYIEKLKGLSPMRKLEQGFSFVAVPGGKALRSVSQVRPGDDLEIFVTDGTVRSNVTETIKTQ